MRSEEIATVGAQPRHITTKYWAKPIPTSQYDWEARYTDDDENGPTGYGSTEARAIADLAIEAEFRAS